MGQFHVHLLPCWTLTHRPKLGATGLPPQGMQKPRGAAGWRAGSRLPDPPPAPWWRPHVTYPWQVEPQTPCCGPADLQPEEGRRWLDREPDRPTRVSAKADRDAHASEASWHRPLKPTTLQFQPGQGTLGRLAGGPGVTVGSPHRPGRPSTETPATGSCRGARGRTVRLRRSRPAAGEGAEARPASCSWRAVSPPSLLAGTTWAPRLAVGVAPGRGGPVWRSSCYVWPQKAHANVPWSLGLQGTWCRSIRRLELGRRCGPTFAPDRPLRSPQRPSRRLGARRHAGTCPGGGTGGAGDAHLGRCQVPEKCSEPAGTWGDGRRSAGPPQAPVERAGAALGVCVLGPALVALRREVLVQDVPWDSELAGGPGGTGKPGRRGHGTQPGAQAAGARGQPHTWDEADGEERGSKTAAEETPVPQACLMWGEDSPSTQTGTEPLCPRVWELMAATVGMSCRPGQGSGRAQRAPSSGQG